ncbi:uncharacterized protein LOC144438866 isoform X2 [Glandiceps talaboti]
MRFQVFMVTVFLAALVLVQAELYKKKKLTEKEFQRSLIDKLSKIQKQKRVNEETDILELCTDDCSPFNNDGDCDDGGPGFDFNLCSLGSDCSDCGSREAPGTPGCSDICHYSDDNVCDDGGAESVYEICNLGTDCKDCGPRDL